MQRASKLIRGMTLPGDQISAEELVFAAWPEAVGRKIASHTRPARMVRERLVVEVEDKTWQHQLFSLTPFILGNLAKALGPGLVGDLEFRVVPRRREPQMAAAAQPALVRDEADEIADPVLRGIYRAARKKARA